MKIWNEIKKQLEQGCSLYLLTVVESTGSAPGRRGFKMLVTDSGFLFGSIGGGIMEFNMVEIAKEFLLDGLIQNQIIVQDHHARSNASSGMICSGSQTIAFNHLSHIDLKWVDSCFSKPVLLDFNENGVHPTDVENEPLFSMNNTDIWSYTEWVNLNNQSNVHIFGAGHVSLPTSELLLKLGYSVLLYDNRENLNTFNDNKSVSAKKQIDYQHVLKSVNICDNDFILLMTHKFTEDKLILTQLLDLNCKYLGVLGSKNKIKVMFDALLNSGFKQEKLDRIHAPIGLDINSQTTEEIAISIVAEIIQTNNS